MSKEENKVIEIMFPIDDKKTIKTQLLSVIYSDCKIYFKRECQQKRPPLGDLFKVLNVRLLLHLVLIKQTYPSSSRRTLLTNQHLQVR